LFSNSVFCWAKLNQSTLPSAFQRPVLK
jgi:hypothetical protein